MIQIETIHLFPGLTAELLKLLKSLKQSEWDLISPIPDREKEKYFDKIRVSGRNELGLRILELVTVMS